MGHGCGLLTAWLGLAWAAAFISAGCLDGPVKQPDMPVRMDREYAM